MKPATLGCLIVLFFFLALAIHCQYCCFMEAQSRAKVSRARADMRSLAVAIDRYRAEHGVYPASLDRAVETLPQDPHAEDGDTYLYTVEHDRFRLHSPGPDRFNQGGIHIYDPTNGSFSVGDVVMLFPSPEAWVDVYGDLPLPWQNRSW